MLIAPYASKKALKENVGKPLRYVETSFFGEEYKADGKFCVSNRPQHPQGAKCDPADASAKTPREFFAEVTMADGLIAKVE